MSNLPSNLVFLCGTRDYHAMDWYRLSIKLYPSLPISLLTDLIAGESYKPLIKDTDTLHKLIIIDNC